LRDPAILRISRNIQLIDDAELTARSVAQRWAAVTLITTDGRRFAAPARTPRGDTDQPLGDAEISAKFHNFADSILGKARADRIEALSGAFDSLDAAGMKELFDLCLTAT
jgi:2-methylcitrate dehydratase PrpD